MRCKRICAGMICAILIMLTCIPLPAYAAQDDEKTVTINGVDFSASAEPENRQQSDRPWGTYKVQGSQNSIAAAGCGVMAVCNALNYATGYFPDPAQLGEWANRNNAGYNGDWTEGTVFFSRFVDEFGGALGFHTAVYGDREGSQSLPRVRTFINDMDAKDILIYQFIRQGGALVAYVENHFIAIVDYNSMTDRFLVWDNNAGDSAGGRRAGITHEAGDWFTWEEMRGTLKNASGDEFQFCIEYVVPLLPTEGRQRFHVSRDTLTVGDLMLQKPGECCNFTPINKQEYDGQSLVFSGSFTSLDEAERIGYRVNGGKTVFADNGFLTASEDARNEGRTWCGEDAATVGFRVAVPVSASDKRYDVVVSEGGVERVIWTAVAASEKYAGNPLVIGEACMESEAVTGGETEASEWTEGTEAASVLPQAVDTKSVRIVPLIAAGVIGTVCAAALPVILKRVGDGKKRTWLVSAAAVVLCVCIAAVLLLCLIKPEQAPEPEEPSGSEETASASFADSVTDTLPEETETEPDADTRPDQYDFSDAEVGSVILFGAYEQDNDPNNGKEPIEWRVLDKQGGKILVISEKALDCQPYNVTFWSMTWERSTLRAWLNRDFLGEAFSKNEQSMIVKTKIAADQNPDYSTTPGNGTSDKVFLLSIREAEQYMGSVRDRRCTPTAYAVAQGAWTSNLRGATDSPACCWWLRTPGGTVFDAAYVHYRGAVMSGGRRVMSVSTACVRPAMWIRTGE